ncbi:alpha/beta hydrolase [Streptomyces sp. NPDC051987]|uniref:alpha/beta fold hydrolase n=1 Tax=Streptomyces sp. NPDC051987 TaxID=3155808 RepID=UPI00343B06AC
MNDAVDVRFLPSSDGDLAYLDTGSGDPVVLLHAGYVDHRFWYRQLPALTDRYRVIASDVRGHGFSANASRPFRWADDLAELLRRLDAGPAVLVGVSMGGVIATDTVLEHPELVRAVVTCGAATGDFRYTDPWHTRLQAEYARTLGAGDTEGWLDAFVRVVAGEHRTLDAVDPEIPRRLRELALHTIAKHTPDEPDLLVRVTDSWSRVPKIDVPVLAVNGGLEPAELLAAADRLAREVPHGRAEIVAGTGHYPNLERPAEFNDLLLGFLRDL